MKPLKILLLTSAQTFVLFACQEPLEEQFAPCNRLKNLSKDIEGEFMLSLDYNLLPRRTGIGSVIMNMTGDGKINQYGTYSLYLEHRMMDIDLSKEALVGNGKFAMNNDAGSLIHGIYDEFELDMQSHQEVKGRILGGSGIFEGAYGGIKIELQPHSKSKFIAIVYGKLRLKRQKERSVLPMESQLENSAFN